MENVADVPYRSFCYTDSMLNEVVWEKVEELYCPLTVDLMASDAIAMIALDLSKEMNSYVFPLFRMIFPMISYLKEQNVG